MTMPLNWETAEERSQWIKANADGFTIIRFLGRGKYERHEHKQLESARTEAHALSKETGKVYMIYATAGIYDTWLESVGPNG